MRILMTFLAVAYGAAAWGEVWLGPAAGWTRATGSTGYAETDGKDVGRSALYWGAAGGYAAGPFYAEGKASFPPGGSDEGPLPAGWGGERKATSYDEFNGDLAGGWRLGEGGLRPTVGLSAYWGRATYEGVDLSPPTPQREPTTAVYSRVVNDFFAAPAAGAELWTGPVKWRGTAAVGYRTHHESGGEWRRLSYETGESEKVYRPCSLAADFVAAEATLAGSWHVRWRLRLEWWLEGRADLFPLGGGEAGERARRDLTFGVAPVVAF